MLYDVEAVLAGLEIPVLREGEKEIRCVCPAHFERTGNADSVGDWSINRDTGEHNCFSCQFSGGSVVSLAAYVMDVPVWEAARWCREFGMADLELVIYEEAGWDRQRARRKARKREDTITISDSHLVLFDEVPQRMLDVRSLDREAALLYEVAWSREHRSWVLPIRLPDRTLLGYQLRNKGWESNQPDDMKKSLTLFGADKFMTERQVVLVESPLDAVRLASLGIYGAMASFGAEVSTDQMQIIVDNFDHLLVAMDNDKAGWRTVDKIWESYRQRLNLKFLDYSQTKEKDVGDMSDDEVYAAVDRAKSLPLRAT